MPVYPGALRDTDNAFNCRALYRDSRRNLTGLLLELRDKLQHILLLTGIKGFDERVLCLNVRVTHRHENFHSAITPIKRKCTMSDYNPTIFLISHHKQSTITAIKFSSLNKHLEIGFAGYRGLAARKVYQHEFTDVASRSVAYRQWNRCDAGDDGVCRGDR